MKQILAAFGAGLLGCVAMLGVLAIIQGSYLGTTHFTNVTVNDDLTVTDDASVGGDLTVTGSTVGGVDLNGVADDLVLDADGDTTLSAPTDDQIDFEVSGADDFRMTANAFTALTGSSIVLAGSRYPLGIGTDGLTAVTGSDVVTGTLAVTHGLTTVTWCLATLGEDPESGAGDAAHVTTAVAANACTVKVWQDDFVTAATETDVVVHWLVIGTP